jgi:FtsZ-binding cell division protein ZapB
MTERNQQSDSDAQAHERIKLAGDVQTEPTGDGRTSVEVLVQNLTRGSGYDGEVRVGFRGQDGSEFRVERFNATDESWEEDGESEWGKYDLEHGDVDSETFVVNRCDFVVVVNADEEVIRAVVEGSRVKDIEGDVIRQRNGQGGDGGVQEVRRLQESVEELQEEVSGLRSDVDEKRDEAERLRKEDERLRNQLREERQQRLQAEGEKKVAEERGIERVGLVVRFLRFLFRGLRG